MVKLSSCKFSRGETSRCVKFEVITENGVKMTGVIDFDIESNKINAYFEGIYKGEEMDSYMFSAKRLLEIERKILQRFLLTLDNTLSQNKFK